MDTASLNNIAQNLLSNDELFDKYYAANGVNYHPNEVCTGECRFVHYCAITEIDYDAYEGCMNVLVSSSSSLQISLIWFLTISALNFMHRQ